MKAFKLMKVTGGLAAAGLLLGYGTASFAAPTCPETNDPQADYKCVYINVGTDKDSDGNSTTGNFFELGLTGTLATSIYTPGLALGSAVYDTNITSILNGFGVSGNTTYTSASGVPNSVGLADTASNPQKNIDSLNSLDLATETEGLNQAGGWRLTFDYYLQGTLTAGGPVFTGGYFNFFYDDLTTGADEHAQVLRVNITGSSLNLANLDLLGTVSYDFNNDNNFLNDCTTPFCQNFWNFQTGNANWYALQGQGIDIRFTLDTNVNPPFPTLDSLGVTTNANNQQYWVRQTTLDSSIRFDVPEPGSLALLGIGLAGIGLRLGSRRKRIAG